MGIFKQKQIEERESWREEMIKEEDQFLMEEEQIKQDHEEMQELVNKTRDIAYKELETALLSLKSWQETRKYSSSLIDDAMHRVGSVIDLMRDNKLWGGSIHEHTK